MSKEVYFVAHPEVVIDPKKEITSWPLSEKGEARAKEMLRQPWINGVRTVFSSKEQKALDLAQIVANHLDLKITSLEGLGEINRSSTGFIEPKEFWPVVKEFYSNPYKSVRGWERATDAQKRIVSAIQEVIASVPNKETIFIASHGAVGALLLSFLKETKINMEDNPPGEGGGYYLIFDAEDWRLIQPWKPIDEL